MNNSIIIALNHPAHYHLFKNLRDQMIENGYDVRFFIKNKEILEKLMQMEGVQYFKYSVTKFVKNSKLKIVIGGLIDLLIQDFTLLKVCLLTRPSVLLGTDIAITHVGWFLRIRSYVFNEDDFDVNKSFCKFAYPFASFIISPNVCDVGNYAFKKVGYEGYQKLAYLHPNRFKPDRLMIAEYVGFEKYFIIRLVSLSAGHDIEKNHKGLSYCDLRQIIDILEPHGRVLISAEKPLPQDFNKYSVNFSVNIIHHLMYYCELFISDSQSMTVECCMLGVPNIRVNTFVGKISVLEELEKKYKLTLGIHPDEKELLLSKVRDFCSNRDLHDLFQSRREKMLSEKMDVTPLYYKFVTGIKD